MWPIGLANIHTNIYTIIAVLWWIAAVDRCTSEIYRSSRATVQTYRSREAAALKMIFDYSNILSFRRLMLHKWRGISFG